MNLHNWAQQIIVDIMQHIYGGCGSSKAAEKVTCNHLQALVVAIEPRVSELEDEVAMLREVLAYSYHPNADEMIAWYNYCDQINACGGNPPDELNHWVGIATSRWEYRPICK